jgi:hypothetical protein
MAARSADIEGEWYMLYEEEELDGSPEQLWTLTDGSVFREGAQIARYTVTRGKLQVHYLDDPQIQTIFWLNSRIEGHMPGNTHQPAINLSSYCTLLRADHLLSA